MKTDVLERLATHFEQRIVTGESAPSAYRLTWRSTVENVLPLPASDEHLFRDKEYVA